MNYLNIILDIIVLVVLAIPVIQGFKNGLVKMILRFGKFLVAFVFSCLLCKPLGTWLRDKWVYSFVHEKISGLVGREAEKGANIDTIAESLPEGLRKSLSTFDVDVSEVAGDVAEAGEQALSAFTDKISGYVANIASVVLAFVVLFIVGLILFLLVGKLLNAIVTRIPVIKAINTWLGGAVGLLLGFISAWGFAQILVTVLGFFAMVDYSGAVVLSFFHRVNPLGWVLGLLANGLHDISSM